MTKYHTNPETGDVNRCVAKIACKFKNARGEEPNHFENKADALKDAEKLLEAKYSGLSSEMISQGYKNHVYRDFNNGYTAQEHRLNVKPYIFDERNIYTREDGNHNFVRVGDIVSFSSREAVYDDITGEFIDDEKYSSDPVQVKKFLSNGNFVVKSLNAKNDVEHEVSSYDSYKIHTMSQPRSNADLKSFTGTWVKASSKKDKDKLVNLLGSDCVAVAKNKGDKTVFVPVPNAFLSEVSKLSSTIKPSKTFKVDTYSMDVSSI